MTKLSFDAQYLRNQSSAYGGIKHYLEAAGNLEKATLAFTREQTVENLAEVVGAHARVCRFKMQAEGRADRGPEVA